MADLPLVGVLDKRPQLRTDIGLQTSDSLVQRFKVFIDNFDLRDVVAVLVDEAVEREQA